MPKTAAAVVKAMKAGDRAPVELDQEQVQLQEHIEKALRDAEVLHVQVIADLQKQKLSVACIEALVKGEKTNWQKFYARFVAQRITPMLRAMSAASRNPGW